MSNKNKVMAGGAFYLLVGGLLFYAASRTLHFVQNVMANSTWGYLFLLATGGGALIWLFVYLSFADGAKQRALAFVMGLVDLIGEMALVYADTIFVGDQAGLVKMSEDEMETFVIVSVAIVGVNIFAGYLFKLFDTTAEQEQQARDLVDHVTAETMKQLNTPNAKAQMVSELAPILAESIKAKVSHEIMMRTAQSGGIPAQAVGLNIPSAADKKELALGVPFLSETSPTGALWLRSITAKDGTKRRAFCLACLREGKSWIGGDLCDHFEAVKVVAPAAELDPAIDLNMSAAPDADNS